MNQILEFFIKMRDLTQPTVAKIQQNVKKIEDIANSSSRGVSRLADNVRSLGRNDPSRGPVDGLNNIGRAADRTREKLEKVKSTVSGSGSGGGFMGMARKFLPFLAGGAIVAGAGAFAKSSAQAYIDFQKNNKSYEVLSGNRGIGQALAGDLNELKQNSILGASVYGNAKTLMSFGITAEKVLPSLKMLGEVSMGDADRFQSLTLAFAQTQSAGKLMGQDLLQYVNAGFNPLHEISLMTGKSMSVLRKEMEKGAISSEMVTNAFKHATEKGGLFSGMLDQMSETTGGRIANMQGKFAALKIAIGERMAPSINSFVSGLTSIITGFKHYIEIPTEKKLTDQIIKIQALQAEITSTNTTHERQLELLRQLEQINPNIVKGIDAQNISYSKLAENINNVTGALRNKIFLEKFDAAKAGVLSSYQSAQELSEKSAGSIMSIIGQVPEIAQRTDLTIDQKKWRVANALRARVAADPNKGIVHGATKIYGPGGALTGDGLSADLDLYNTLKGAMKDQNNALGTIARLQPEINSINKTKDALTKTIDQYTGVKSMTAAQIENKGGGGKSGSAAGSPGTEVASGITGGGPRVININGVKFAEKIEIHAATMGEGAEEMERKLEEMFLRILNSGASVQ